MDDFKIGDIVRISEEGYANEWIGQISDLCGRITKFRVMPMKLFGARIPVMFPGFIAPRWFLIHECHAATNIEQQFYFKELLRRGK